MAIDLTVQYPGNVDPASPDYPYGQARNITVPGDGTGTPWEAALANDLLGHQQATLTAGGEVPSGTSEKATNSQYLKAAGRVHGLEFDLLNDAKAAVYAKEGAVAKLRGRTTAGVGAAEWQYVTGETANGINIINHDTLPLQLKLVPSSPVIVSQWGADPANDIATNSAAIQAAYDSLTPNGTLIFSPTGVYEAEGLEFGKADVTVDFNQSELHNTGTGTDTVQLSPALSFNFRQRLHNGTIRNGATAGHCLNAGFGFSQCEVDLNLFNANPAKGVMSASFSAGGIFDTIFAGGEWTISNSHTVPAFEVLSVDTARFNDNTFKVKRYNRSGTAPFFSIRSSVATNWNYANKWVDANFEVCNGGAVHCTGARGFELHNIMNWDLNVFNGGVTTDDFIRFDQEGAGLNSTNNIVSNYTRTEGSLGVGKYDIALGLADDTLLFQTSSNASVGATHDLNNRRAVIHKTPGETFVNVGLTNVTILEPTLVTAPTLQVNGDANVDGRASVRRLATTYGGILTLVAGVITPTRAYHHVETEGLAASDDLVTVTAGEDGDILTLRPANDARTVVVKHGTGNIRLSGSVDFTMDSTRDRIVLQYDAALSEWVEWGGQTNGGA